MNLVTAFLLDTNIPSELTYPRPEPLVELWLNETSNEQLFFSVISLAEICKGIAKLPESKKRDQLQAWLDKVLRPWFAGRILPVDEAIAERMGRWAGEHETRGRTIKIADGLIAATAFEFGLTIVTRNTKDFEDLGVPVLNPWEQT